MAARNAIKNSSYIGLQQHMSAMLTTLFSVGKELLVLFI